MPQIPTGFAHVTHTFLNRDTLEENAVTYGVDLDTTADSLQDIVDALDSLFRVRFLAQIDDGIEVTPARMQVGNDGPPLVQVSTIPTQVGTRSGTAAPPQVALVVTKRTGFGGVQYRGRMFMPGMLSTTDVDQAGRVANARRAALQTAATTWLENLSSGGLTGFLTGNQPMVLLHSLPSSGSPAPTPTLVTSLEVQGVVGTQRGRLPRN